MMQKKLSTLTKILQQFLPRKDHGDLIWEFYLKINHRWQQVVIKEYQGVYYFSGSHIGTFSSDEVYSWDEDVEEWFRKIQESLRKLHRELQKSPLHYHRKLNHLVSKNLRQGFLPRKHAAMLLPELNHYIDGKLSAAEKIKIDMLLSHRSCERELDVFTAEKYFEYCHVAYRANGSNSHRGLDRKMSGRELYMRWADGRDGGLLHLDPCSSEEFARWYDGKEWQGTHPWEIYRGGNSTHIDLGVRRGDVSGKWEIYLAAQSSTRLAETCKIALAFQKEKLPFKLYDSESYLFRLRHEDNIGIVPRHWPIRYAWHEFPKELHVYDCLYFDDLKDSSKELKLLSAKQVADLITWFPLPVLESSLHR